MHCPEPDFSFLLRLPAISPRRQVSGFILSYGQSINALPWTRFFISSMYTCHLSEKAGLWLYPFLRAEHKCTALNKPFHFLCVLLPSLREGSSLALLLLRAEHKCTALNQLFHLLYVCLPSLREGRSLASLPSCTIVYYTNKKEPFIFIKIL